MGWPNVDLDVVPVVIEERGGGDDDDAGDAGDAPPGDEFALPPVRISIFSILFFGSLFYGSYWLDPFSF